MNNEALSADPEITIRLPLSAWKVVAVCLGAGVYREVAEIIGEITRQATPQLEAAEKASEAAATPDVATPEASPAASGNDHAEGRMH